MRRGGAARSRDDDAGASQIQVAVVAAGSGAARRGCDAGRVTPAGPRVFSRFVVPLSVSSSQSLPLVTYLHPLGLSSSLSLSLSSPTFILSVSPSRHPPSSARSFPLFIFSLSSSFPSRLSPSLGLSLSRSLPQASHSPAKTPAPAATPAIPRTKVEYHQMIVLCLSGNKGLCGVPSLPACPMFWENGKLSTPGKIAIGFSCLFVFCAILLLVYIYIRRRRNDYDFALPHELTSSGAEEFSNRGDRPVVMLLIQFGCCRSYSKSYWWSESALVSARRALAAKRNRYQRQKSLMVLEMESQHAKGLFTTQ
ncbi:hypothetical protein Fmac_001539 [Flemingia macrophylla]|uniref:Uncharacterized protein n=1 Tax=Flemingia macrophylla TaxID=520843 RepID=A0ABD1NHE5_9FABA